MNDIALFGKNLIDNSLYRELTVIGTTIGKDLYEECYCRVLGKSINQILKNLILLMGTPQQILCLHHSSSAALHPMALSFTDF